MSLTVELDEQSAAVVQKLAAHEQRSAGEVIHDALAAYACRGDRPLPTGMGKYRSGHSDTSAKVDEILADAVNRGLWP
jgi:Ribbon-helix-helix protein, copG family